MQEKFSNNAINIIARLKKVLKIKTDTELSEALNVAQSTISSWKTRDTIDYNLIIAHCNKYDINLHWLLTGDEKIKNENIAISEPKFEYGKKKEDVIVKEVIFRIEIGEDIIKDIKLSFHKQKE